jgi:hypothetical protein
VSEVVKIDTPREFAVSYQPPMLTPRSHHAAVHHAQHLYVLGGYASGRNLSECERYVCAESRWEALPPLPRVCSDTTGVVVARILYALGGIDGDGVTDLIQRLNLAKLTWEVMQMKLPYEWCAVSCFKLTDTEVYLVVNPTLYSFTPLEIQPLKSLPDAMQSFYGASYYSRGTLYCSYTSRAAKRLALQSLD